MDRRSRLVLCESAGSGNDSAVFIGNELKVVTSRMSAVLALAVLREGDWAPVEKSSEFFPI